MIFRRLKEAMNQQSWFAVMIELLVIALGIFAGLQIDAWQEARTARAEADYYLGRLVHEFDETIELMEQSAVVAEELFDRSGRAVGVLRAGSLNDDNMAAFSDDFRAFFGLANFRFTASSLAELHSTGSFDAIEDRELRAKLINFQETVDIRREQSELLSDSFGPAVMQLLDEIDVAADFMSSNTILSSPDELRDNASLLRIMVKIHLMQDVQRSNLDSFLEELRAVRADIAGHAGIASSPAAES